MYSGDFSTSGSSSGIDSAYRCWRCRKSASCHCPDGGDGKSDQPQLEACHQDVQAHVAPVLPAFTAPIAAALPVAPVGAASFVHALSTPHAPPPPPRPAGPS